VIVIPSTVLFIAFDAVADPSYISIADCDSCPEFNRWQELIKRDIEVDFRRILRIGTDFGELNDYLMNDSVFEKGSMLGVFARLSNEIYQRSEDGSSMIVKTISGMKSKESLRMIIENQLTLSHPCIHAPIAFIFGTDSTKSGEVKIVKLYWEGPSLSEVISKNPVWWTATAKAKVIAGIVLSLRFAHSFGLIYGHLTSQNIVFDVDHRIQITEFYPTLVEVELDQITRMNLFTLNQIMRLNLFISGGC
jgi:serine/threonine protein kinase